MNRGSLSHYARCLGGDLQTGGAILCPGPGHSRRDRSLSVQFNTDGTFTAYSFANDDWQLCRDHVRHLCGMEPFRPGLKREEQAAPVDTTPRRNRRIERVSHEQKAAACWQQAGDPRGTLVEKYLDGRGIHCLDHAAIHALRFSPQCAVKRTPDEPTIYVPAMVALYTPIFDYVPGAPPTAIHRTILRENGNGHLGKRMLGSVRGQVVRLSAEPVEDTLYIAEGIETSLMLVQRGYHPVWAATTAGAMRLLPIIPQVRRLVIGADHDFPGVDAAQQCADRWADAGKDVSIDFPRRAGADFADEGRQ